MCHRSSSNKALRVDGSNINNQQDDKWLAPEPADPLPVDESNLTLFNQSKTNYQQSPINQ